MNRWKREALPAVVDNVLLPALGAYGSDYGYDLPSSNPDIVIDPTWPHSPDGTWNRTDRGIQLTLHGGDAWTELPDQAI